MGTDGRWNDANSPIDPWQHGHEGGAERGWRRRAGGLLGAGAPLGGRREHPRADGDVADAEVLLLV